MSSPKPDGARPPEPPCDCNASTNIADEISCGRGKLDFYGFWSIPCTHGLAAWLNERMPK